MKLCRCQAFVYSGNATALSYSSFRCGETLEGRAAVVPVRAQDAGKALGAVKGDPRELAAVVVQEARRQADAAPGGDVGQRGVVSALLK
jgi:hypothetical protein